MIPQNTELAGSWIVVNELEKSMFIPVKIEAVYGSVVIISEEHETGKYRRAVLKTDLLSGCVLFSQESEVTDWLKVNGAVSFPCPGVFWGK